MSEYVHDEWNFEGLGGLKIHYQIFKPKKYNTVVVIVHGLGEHGGRYRFPIEYFVDKGIAFYTFDHRGHGKSEGKRGHVDHFGELLGDLKTLVNIIKKREGKKKYFLLGQSLGGLIAIRFVETYPKEFDGAMIASSTLKLKIKLPEHRIFLSKKFSKYLPKFSMRSEMDPHFLSHDRDVVKKYINDKLVHNKITVRFFTEIVDAMAEAIDKAEKISLPFLVMYAGADEFASADGSRDFYEKLGSKDKKLIIYDGYYHEIMNEVGRDRVFTDIQKWLKPWLK